MSSRHPEFNNNFRVEEPRTPPSATAATSTDQLTRSARRINLADNMRKNISRTKSGFVPRGDSKASRIDNMETEIASLRGKLISTETLLNKYRSALEVSEDERARMMTGIKAVIENFEMALSSSESENKVATYEMSKALQDVASLLLTRHEKDLAENAQLFSAAISSLRVLTSPEEPALPLLEQ